MSVESTSKYNLLSGLIYAALLGAFFVLFLGVIQVDAAPRRGFEALHTETPSRSELQFAPGEVKDVTIGFKNIGDQSWKNDGDGYVSLYTYGPKYRRSAFDPGTWLGPTQVKRIKETSVGVNEVGTLTFELHAPMTTGEYDETFKLAAEEVTWIPGGEFTLHLEVTDSPIVIPTNAEGSSIESDESDLSDLIIEELKERVGAIGYDATVLLRSTKKVVTAGGMEVKYTVGIKNTGTEIWSKREVKLPGVQIASTQADLIHSSWKNSTLLALSDRGTVAPGQLDFLSFTFTAPRTVGEHLVTFQLVANGELVEGGEIVIPVDVTSGAPDAVVSPLRDGVIDRAEKIEEPIVRVGILIVDEETSDQIVVSCACNVMSLKDENGTLLAEVPRGSSATAFYKTGKYFFDAGRGLEASSYPIRFIPESLNQVLTITNFDRTVTRGSRNVDNQFRNILEIRHNDYKDRTWVINEIPIETYLRGLAETSNVSHMEYQKSIITAARTYAYFQWQRRTKHAREGFMLDAYVDQVYKGYGQELRMPRLVEAIGATYGVTVTYDGQTAITPYFSRSDGRTRNWGDVWAGDVAWLRGVPVPCDEGKTLWGHGIGMSASGALCEANNGSTWKEILHHYYTGIDFRREWDKL
ncbi:MAG: hypothetical protein O2877_01230 [bacterium]|nr:hypothetical protein [bacterium]